MAYPILSPSMYTSTCVRAYPLTLSLQFFYVNCLIRAPQEATKYTPTCCVRTYIRMRMYQLGCFLIRVAKASRNRVEVIRLYRWTPFFTLKPQWTPATHIHSWVLTVCVVLYTIAELWKDKGFPAERGNALWRRPCERRRRRPKPPSRGCEPPTETEPAGTCNAMEVTRHNCGQVASSILIHSRHNCDLRSRCRVHRTESREKHACISNPIDRCKLAYDRVIWHACHLPWWWSSGVPTAATVATLTEIASRSLTLVPESWSGRSMFHFFKVQRSNATVCQRSPKSG